MAEVKIQALSKTYSSAKGSDFHAVKGIDLTVRDKELMILVGPSGCGKSTTLRMIAGLESITSGSISINGTAVNEVQPKDRDIAMVFQNYALYPHMTVFENMAFGLKRAKLPTKTIQSRIHEAAHTLGLESLLDRKPNTLSGGQRQRVAVGRAIVRQPAVFLFDEPLSNLDAKTRVATRMEIAKLHTDLEATMIYVTHDQVEAMTLGDRICIMNHGRIMQIGPPMEVYHQPENLFVARFIGSPAMNILDAEIEIHDEQVYAKIHDDFRIPVHVSVNLQPGQSIKLGVRPEAIRVSDTGQDTLGLKVTAHEAMGNETIIHLSNGNLSLVVRDPSAGTYTIGQELNCSIESTQAVLFDPQTERALR